MDAIPSLYHESAVGHVAEVEIALHMCPLLILWLAVRIIRVTIASCIEDTLAFHALVISDIRLHLGLHLLVKETLTIATLAPGYGGLRCSSAELEAIEARLLSWDERTHRLAFLTVGHGSIVHEPVFLSA